MTETGKAGKETPPLPGIFLCPITPGVEQEGYNCDKDE